MVSFGTDLNTLNSFEHEKAIFVHKLKETYHRL